MRNWDKRRRLLARWTLISTVIVAAAAAWFWATRDHDLEAVRPGDEVAGLTSILARDSGEDATALRFTDVSAETGIDFSHFPATRASLLPEDMGSGVAVGDFDDDGKPDLFFVNFAGNAGPMASVDPEKGKSRLYRNVDGARFDDVTDRAGIDFAGYGMGAAWADFDDDGDLDVYITAFGPNALYENLGDGTFRDVTDKTGTQDARFSAGCSWGDYDRDGHIDLYVTNYVNFVYREADRKVVERQYATEQPYTINPSSYAASPNSLFRSSGDGTFEEVAETAGIDDPQGRSLSASWVDFDNDGWLDLYVANDVSNNGVFRNRGDGTFTDVGPSSLAADYRGAMGIAVADFDDDLDEDILITHWIAQENALYRNMALDEMLGASEPGRIWFMDEADEYGLGQSSLDMVGWATGFVDFDNDGRRDLWLVNGSTLENTADHTRLETQPPFLFYNRGNDGFVDTAARASDTLATPIVGRGGAHVDFNNDGRVDWVILVHGGTPIVLANATPESGHYLRLSLRQPGPNRRAIAARAYVTAGGHEQMAVVGSGSSYLSQNELTLHFGLGRADSIDSVRIVWPDGAEETHRNPPVDRTLTFTRTKPD